MGHNGTDNPILTFDVAHASSYAEKYADERDSPEESNVLGEQGKVEQQITYIG